MKKTLSILILFLFLLLVWYSWAWYKDAVICCPEEVAEEPAYGPLVFDCTTGEVVINDLWPEKKKEILAERPEGKALLLVGPYFTSEATSDGIARAEMVKALFTELPADDIHTSARLAGNCEATLTDMLHGLRYKWVTRNADVIEHLDHTKIFYKFDSDEEITSDLTRAYFNELAEFLKSSSDQIMITGYTDADGEEDYNLELGLKRATEYKDHLIGLGVDESKISVDSKGEANPWKPNDTEENKRLNRRVEIHIID